MVIWANPTRISLDQLNLREGILTSDRDKKSGNTHRPLVSSIAEIASCSSYFLADLEAFMEDITFHF